MSKRAHATQPTNHRETAIVSSEEASTWLRQAEVATGKLNVTARRKIEHHFRQAQLHNARANELLKRL